jgi:hypothetical protein
MLAYAKGYKDGQAISRAEGILEAALFVGELGCFCDADTLPEPSHVDACPTHIAAELRTKAIGMAYDVKREQPHAEPPRPGGGGMVMAGTSSTNIHLEGSEQVWPCRCGDTHRGEWAVETFAHHNCFHQEPLLLLAIDYAVCGECGETFGLEDHRL